MFRVVAVDVAVAALAAGVVAVVVVVAVLGILAARMLRRMSLPLGSY